MVRATDVQVLARGVVTADDGLLSALWNLVSGMTALVAVLKARHSRVDNLLMGEQLVDQLVNQLVDQFENQFVNKIHTHPPPEVTHLASGLAKREVQVREEVR